MIELDFLFIYEHKVREFENLCLIKYELDKRGYISKILYVDDAKSALAVKPIYHAKVLFVLACYGNHTLYWQTKEFVKFDKIVDMQWENIVYPKDENRIGAYKNYSGIGKNVVRVSWGEQNRRRLIDVVQMDEKKVKKIGHVGMDFLRYPLNRYYMSRSELFSKYELDNSKETILFASPYYGDSLSEEYIEDMCNRFGEDWRDYYLFMCKSQEKVIEWFRKICEEDSNIQFVFRPHPGHPSELALKTADELENFHVISSESVKQWVLVCNRIFTGNSSVIVEAYFAKKMCHLLFPYPVTKGFELNILSDANKISDFKQFKKAIYSESECFPISKEKIEEVYDIDWKMPSYVKFANMAEEVMKNDYYKVSRKDMRRYKPKFSIKIKIIRLISKFTPLYALYLKVIDDKKINNSFIDKQREIRKSVTDLENEKAFELTNEKEISDTILKIRNAIEEES